MKCYLRYKELTNVEYNFSDKFDFIFNALNEKIKFPERKYENVLIVGVGGSSLGTHAIYDFLKYKNKLAKIWFLESFDPFILQHTINNLDFSNCLVIFVSKSGNTVEMLGICKYLLKEIKDMNFIVITDKGSNLEKFANSHNATVYNIPKDVGGRFSFFTVASLIPLHLVGVNTEALCDGVKQVLQSFIKGEQIFNNIITKAKIFSENRYNNVIFSYSNVLESFNKWYLQLWAESLGKQDHNGNRIGLTPIGLIGSQDQHSFLQLLVEGILDKNVTFLTIEEFSNDIVVPNVKLENSELLENHKFGELLNKQAKATEESLVNLDLYIDTIQLNKVDESEIGYLMGYYVILTIITAHFLDINPYGQDGVEVSKNIFKELLKNDK